MVEGTVARTELEPLRDEDLVRKVIAGDTALFEIIMRRYNQRIYRAARSIVRDEALAEDVMQAAYVQAYENLRQYSGRAPLRSLAHTHRHQRGSGAPARHAPLRGQPRRGRRYGPFCVNIARPRTSRRDGRGVPPSGSPGR